MDYFKEVPQGDPADAEDPEFLELIENYKRARRVHLDAYDTLSAVLNNPGTASLVPFRDAVVKALNHEFSHITYRFYTKPSMLREDHLDKLTFNPAEKESPILFADEDGLVVRSRMMGELKNIMPSVDFTSKRIELCENIEKRLIDAHAVPAGTKLLLFGSSRNSFGSEGADLDMCLQIHEDLTGDGKEELMTKIGEVLETAGVMEEVEVRASARIPIVMFKFPEYNLDCDISCNNPLAIYNTELLRAYGMIDPRVRELAYIIKHWAKKRQINSPQFSTLSSYGYLLCLIHFLQSRKPPVVPNLQKLPPDWVYHDTHPGYERTEDGLLLGSDNRVLPQVLEKSVKVGVRGHVYPYFFRAETEEQKNSLAMFAARNTETSENLLGNFFKYFAWDFDYRNSVVSVRSFGSVFNFLKSHSNHPYLRAEDTPATIPKIYKQERDCWSPGSRLSIEDPFETWYDVGHVIRNAQMWVIRKEFLRAYTIFARTKYINPSNLISYNDAIPDIVQPDEIFDLLFEEAEEPSEMKKV